MKTGIKKRIKEMVIRKTRELGASLVGFAPASRWDYFDEVPLDYRPKSIWSEVRTVIVAGVELPLPILESTPSINYQELYNTSNILLDQIGLRLSAFLNEKGYAGIFMPRDGYGNLEILLKKPFGCFSHVFAGKYAGLGTIGYHHMLINPKYGTRVRYVSIFTSADLEGTKLVKKPLCNRCKLCERLCPAKAFSENKNSFYADMNKEACTRRHLKLREECHWPCGICAKVCPVGEDRKLYKSQNLRRYLEEYAGSGSAAKSQDPVIKGWEHLRSHGSSSGRKEAL